jgi:hypothetical protein
VVWPHAHVLEVLCCLHHDPVPGALLAEGYALEMPQANGGREATPVMRRAVFSNGR